MKVRVHNNFEAKALTKEFQRDGTYYGELIIFIQHETKIVVGLAEWKGDHLQFQNGFPN